MSISSLGRKKRILSALETCLLSAGLTAAILAAVYALRGIWPFGTDNVAYMDAAQFYVPGYYRLWDSLHGAVSESVDWFSGLAEGSNYDWHSLLYPYNWVFLLVDRGHVLEGLSLFLAVHLVIIDLIAAIAVSVRFPKLGVAWRTCLALSYTFCGFTLQYYSNFMWLDIVALFPLLLLGLDRLLREGKPTLYLLLYMFYLYRSVYFTYMVTVYVLLYTLGWCWLVLPREQRGRRLFQLGLATALAYGVCVMYWRGGAAAVTGTARFQDNVESGIQAGMTTWDITYTRHTFLMLLGLGLCFAVLALAWRAGHTAAPEARDRLRRGKRFFLYMAAVFALPMVFTNIDTAWHFGQYNFFPMRYGYMIPATVIGFAGEALEGRDGSGSDAPAKKAPFKRPGLAALLAGAAAAVLALKLPGVLKAFRQYGACFLDAMGQADYFRYFAALILCGAAAVTLYCLVLRGAPRRTAPWIAATLLAVQLGANAGGLIAPSDDHTYTNEYDPTYLAVSEQLYDYFAGQDISPLSRTKNVDGSLSAGYPAVAGTSALSSIQSGNSATRLGVYRELGYTVNYCRIMDVGGTVFTDMLLGVDRALSESGLDEDLYVPGETVAGVQLGASRYPGVIGLMYDPADLADYFDLETLPDRLNALYRAFTGAAAPVASVPETEMTVASEGMRTYTLTVTLDAPAFVYMAVDGMAMNITAGGRDVAVPTYLNLDNRVYPAAFNSNLLSLGLFPAGKTEIVFTSGMDLAPDAIALTALDRQMLEDFPADALRDPDMTVEPFSNGLTVTLAADRAGRELFLPLAGWWSCAVNGESVPCGSFLETMVSVPLQAGENTVVLYRGDPPAGVAGDVSASSGPDLNTVVSWSCMLLALVWLAAGPALRRKALPMPRLLSGLVQTAFLAVTAAVIGFVYIAPTFSLITNGSIIWF